MKYLGIELKGNEAMLCAIDGSSESFTFIAPEHRKIGIKDPSDQKSIRQFFLDICSYLDAHNFDRIAIKARATKGRFAGGSVSFKMEALIQNSQHTVDVIAGATVKAKLKQIIDDINFSDVKVYQKEALTFAIYLSKCS